MTGLAAGALAPDFDLPRTGGGSLKLSDLRGRPVVLYFYPQDDTSTCTAEAIDFSALKSQFDAAGAMVIGVSPDSLKKHDKFKAKYGLELDLLADQDKKTLEAYGVWGEKTTFGRTYEGVVRTTFLIGPDGRIVRVWAVKRVAGHAQKVLDAVRAL